MREFKNLEFANEILDFFDIHYNFIDRQKIRGKLKTPAEAAWINLKLGDKYKLLKLIENIDAED